MAALRPWCDGAGDEGFVIVAVLWILGALATLALVYTFYVHQMAVDSVGHEQRIQVQALEQAGVELAAYQLTADPKARPLQGKFSFRQGIANISVQFSCENSRIDLNFAPKDLLTGLFMSIGAQREAAQEFAARIVAWRTPLKKGASDAEVDIYQSSGKAYGPRHGPFEAINEAGLVAGLPPYLLDRALPYLTVFSGESQINPLSAPSQVLAAVPGLSAASLQSLLTTRVNAPQDVVRAQLGGAVNYFTMTPSNADRVTVDVTFPSGTRYRGQAIILVVDGDRVPYRVLSWRDWVPVNESGEAAGLQ